MLLIFHVRTLRQQKKNSHPILFFHPVEIDCCTTARTFESFSIRSLGSWMMWKQENRKCGGCRCRELFILWGKNRAPTKTATGWHGMNEMRLICVSANVPVHKTGSIACTNRPNSSVLFSAHKSLSFHVKSSARRHCCAANMALVSIDIHSCISQYWHAQLQQLFFRCFYSSRTKVLTAKMAMHHTLAGYWIETKSSINFVRSVRL